MTKRSHVGTRIREQRMKQGLHQTELARKAGISASYLNLIEHNRRRIGGATLLRLATILGASPNYLSEGASDKLINGLAEIAGSPYGQEIEAAHAQDFAGQFPDWAELVLKLYQSNTQLQQRIHDLTDRLASDPELSDALHEVMSTVTSIRSAASILARSETLEPEWQHRFHRNIDEDSRRLADSSAALMHYLENHDEPETRTPQDEATGFFETHGFHIPELEQDNADIPKFLSETAKNISDHGKELIRKTLNWLSDDACALPLAQFAQLVRVKGPNPYLLAQELDVGLPLIFRRLATLPDDIAGPVGLVICDTSGALIFRKPIAGFSIPRGSSTCTLWPLFQSLGAPQIPLRLRLQSAGKKEATVLSVSATQTTSPQSFVQPALSYGHMLLLPDRHSLPDDPLRIVGTSCHICSLKNCTGRREPSILA